VLGLQGALVETDGLIEVAIGAKLQDQVDVVLALEGLNQIYNIVVRAEAKVNAEFLGALVNGESGGAVDGSGGLGDDLDCNVVASYEVLGLEDHAKGAMIEGRNGFVSSIEHNAFVKLIAHALHRDDW
jgi:hypothetical protein